jgi:hypothetical protein
MFLKRLAGLTLCFSAGDIPALFLCCLLDPEDVIAYLGEMPG